MHYPTVYELANLKPTEYPLPMSGSSAWHCNAFTLAVVGPAFFVLRE